MVHVNTIYSCEITMATSTSYKHRIADIDDCLQSYWSLYLFVIRCSETVIKAS